MRRILALVAATALAMSIGTAAIAAQVTIPEPPDLPGGGQLPEIPVDVTDTGVEVNLNDVSVVSDAETGTSVSAGEINVSVSPDGGVSVSGVPGADVSLPPAEEGATELPEGPLTVDLNGISIVSTTENDTTSLTIDVTDNGTAFTCDLTLSEGVTLDEFLAALEADESAPDDATADLTDDQLVSFVVEHELGTVSCTSG